MKKLKSILFFWKKQNQMETNQEKPFIAEELFCENNPDLGTNETDKMPKLNPLIEFKDRDFKSIGYKVGFEEHSSDAMDNYTLKFKAEFRNIIQMMKDKSKSEIFTLKNELVDAQSISIRLTKKIELRIEQIESNTNTLDYELELSILNEGFVMEAIHNFNQGYKRGYGDYLELRVLGAETGLFTN